MGKRVENRRSALGTRHILYRADSTKASSGHSLTLAAAVAAFIEEHAGLSNRGRQPRNFDTGFGVRA